MSASSAAPRKKRSRARGCLIWLLILIVVLAVVAGAGYFAYQSGAISLIQIQTMIDGVGEVSVVNTADEELTVRFVHLDTEDGEPDTLETERLAPLDVGGLGAMPLGRYTIEFSTSGGNPPAATCALTVGRGDKVTFFAVPQGIVVAKDGFSPRDRADMLVESSSLCRR